MDGQWLGRYEGSNSGLAMIELDRTEAGYDGQAYIYDDNSTHPAMYAPLRIEGHTISANITVQVFPLHPLNLEPVQWDIIQDRFPGVIAPTHANVSFALEGTTLKVAWESNIGTKGHAVLPESLASQSSILEPLAGIDSWSAFKEYVSTLNSDQYIFRGQDDVWRLRTSFHRTGRVNISKFLSEDLPALYRSLNFRTRHVYDRKDPDQNGAFVHLAQHHGYPTPLLDWTYSPFVAGFFAYRRVVRFPNPSGRIRIFKFDRRSWMQDFRQIPHFTRYGPHFSLLDFSAIDNERMIPQQALSSVTNVDDIETYIQLREGVINKRYLEVIDLPQHERALVMKDLRLMGITAGSLLPGLDGTCEELREHFFKW